METARGRACAASDRLRLVVPRASDLAFIRSLWADPATMKPVGGPVILTDDEALNWFARMVRPGRPTDHYRLIVTRDGRPVGEVSCHRLDREAMSAGLNIKILAAERGRGLARVALRAFLDWYFGEFGGRLLTDDLAPGNAAGQRLLESFGFERADSDEKVVRLRLTRERYRGRAGDGV